MKSFLAKSGIALALGATALTTAMPAQAQRYGGYHRGHDSAGPAIVAGILGLGIGAAIASSNHDRRYDERYDQRYDTRYRSNVYDGYDQPQGYYQDNGYAYRDGYDTYSRAPVCTLQRSWDRYSGRSTVVRICR